MSLLAPLNLRKCDYMKLPNGYGSVYKLSGKRRNPYIARKTTGWSIDKSTGKAKQQFITVGYYPTKAAALQALADYNANPYDIQVNTITFKEVYEKWANEHFETIVSSAQRTWVSAFNHSAPLHDMRFRDIRVNHLEQTIKDANVGQPTKQRMKSLYNLMYKYALKHEICDKDYAALCNSVKRGAAAIVRIPFSDAEIDLLFNSLAFPFVDMLLIGIYTGFRPQELAILKLADIDLKERTITGGLKTDAGRNRVVPIHSRVYGLVESCYNKAAAVGCSTLFYDETSQTGIELTYDKWRGRFKKIMQRFKLKHTPHDTRHTFITKAKAAGVDDYILKLIVGHAIDDITEKVYTHRTLDDLRKEIEKID